MSKFLDKTGLDTLWAKIKSTFQTLGNLVTAWGSTPSDTKYPSEKLVKDSLNAYNDIGGRNLLSNTKISATHFTRVDNTTSYKGAAFTFDGADADSYFSLGFLESIATGETVTFSCDVSGLNEASNEYISFLLASLTSWTTYKINKNGHASFVITRTNTGEIVPGTSSLTIDDNPRFAATAPSGFTISNIKLERNSVSTSYSKHPAEDPKGVYYVTGSSDYVAYSASSTYTATTSSGPFTSENSCTYGGIAYFCKTAITTPEAWNSSHWTIIATPVLTGTIDGLTALYAGLKIAYKMSIRGGTSSTYLNINNLGNKYIRRNDSNLTTHLPANTVVFLAYDGTYWRWADYDYAPNNWVTTMGAYCETAAATQAKTATSTNTVYTAGEAFLIRIVNANTYNGKITLNINGQGAKDVWINGAISSSSNKTLPAGEHWCYYDGSVFHIWTDGTAQFAKLKAETITGNLLGNAATATAAAGYTSGGDIDTALGNKQDALGINSSTGDTTKYLNERGQWATPAGTAQVQSDWAQTDTSAVDYIKNKPSAVMWLTYGTSYTSEQISGWLTSGYLLCVSYSSRVYVYAKDSSYQGTYSYFFIDARDYAYLRVNIVSSTCTWSEGDNYPAYVKYLEGTVSSAHDTMTVSKDSSNQTVVSSGDGTTAAPVYIRPKGHTAADNQFVVHEDGSISLNKFHSRFGYIEHHYNVPNEKVIRFGFSRTVSNVSHRESCIRLQYARNHVSFEVRIAINISTSGTVEAIGATVTCGNSVSSVNVPKVYSYSNANWHWVFVAFSRGDANIDHYLNWEYSGENSDGLNVTLVEAVHSDASAVTLCFIPIGNVNVDSGSFSGIGSATRPVYVNRSGQVVACDIFYA